MLMLSNLTTDQFALANLMSKISERCYSAGWMANLEFALWHALLHGPCAYGQGFITETDIANLRSLSDQADCWIVFDDVNEETAISLQTWRHVYSSKMGK
ncbi:hypothetical protein LZZ85_17115 [Terrimonas sp. NA20]|uniref:Uncharacterized protein n=1 Tax=Terrimonas ginsenosidimutans TaxID=2908004 RepID=A0ABS9KUN7_9BACT|nr:hypothetical protein [Terrimonas ginsenosidimutans]MCG2616020.1 hypothetical protein [Terrimonas ginsenosidimutans]